MEAAAELFEELGIGNSIRLPKVKKKASAEGRIAGCTI
jgi:hypothetical protein